MALSGIIGDKRLFINKDIKENCLDKMRDGLKERGVQVEAIDLVLLGMAVVAKEEASGIISPDCNRIGNNENEKTMIVSLNRLSDEQIGAMIALAVDKSGSTEIIKDIGKAVELWQMLAEEGLKKLYCQYFLDFGTSNPEVGAFFDRINNLLNKYKES